MTRFVPALALLAGCFRAPPPPDLGTPGSLSPLEDENLAPEVPSEPGDPFPEALAFAVGRDEAADRYWAHARGWVHADAAAVWAALRVHEVMVDRRGVDAWTVEEGVRPEFDFSFAVQNTVNAFLTVQFELTWVHELQLGPPALPERVVARWDKTDGTGFIDLLSGSVLIRGIDAGLTEIEVIEHLRAAQRDEQTLVQYITDLHTEIVAVVHDQPLPTY